MFKIFEVARALLFKGTADSLYEELIVKKKIFIAVRAVFNEPEIRDTVFAGLVDILYGDSPKEAVISLLTFINEKLQGSQSFEKVFDITLEEAELFDVLVGALRFELFDRSQIYKVIMVMSYVADDQLRDESVDKITALVYGPNPKEALLDGLIFFINRF